MLTYLTSSQNLVRLVDQWTGQHLIRSGLDNEVLHETAKRRKFLERPRALGNLEIILPGQILDINE